jgi:hypothetical protein
MRATPAHRQRADTDVKGLPPESGTVVVYQVNGVRVEWSPSPGAVARTDRENAERLRD